MVTCYGAFPLLSSSFPPSDSVLPCTGLLMLHVSLRIRVITEESLIVLAKIRSDGVVNDPVVQSEYKQIRDEVLLEHELEIRR
jgi:hypothetical protein